jgi:hypothetical protein
MFASCSTLFTAWSSLLVHGTRGSDRLSQLGFVPSKADTSLFIFQHDGVQIFMPVYVDDIVIVGSTPAAVDRLVRVTPQIF